MKETKGRIQASAYTSKPGISPNLSTRYSLIRLFVEVRRFILPLICLGGGTLAFLALISRVYSFWLLSRWPRMILLGMGALLCSLLLGLALRAAWKRLSCPPRARKLVWLAVAFAAGILVRLFAPVPAPAMPLLYVLEIQTPGTAAQTAGPVVFIELRDYSGKPVLPADLTKEGSWQPTKEGWQAQSDQPATLRYSFYAPPQGKIQMLFTEQPGAGQIQLALDGKKQQVDLSSPAKGQRLVDLPFQKQSRWSQPIALADLALLGFVFPAFLFIVPFAALDGVRWTRRSAWPRLRLGLGAIAHGLADRFDYQKLFIVVFFGLCLLPFLNFKGNLSTINQFFGEDNAFWNVYTRVRQNIFGDRLIGNALIGKDGWLVMTSDYTIEDYQNTIPLTEEQLFQLQQRIDGTTRYLKAKGITFLIVIPPNKNTIYPDRVPAQVQIIGKKSRLDQILEYERQHGGVQILDLRPTLQAARKDHEVYYRTDTHWNLYGSFAAYTEVMRALQKDFPQLTPHTLNDFRYVPGEKSIGDIGYRWVPGAPVEQYFTLQPLFARSFFKLDTYNNRILYSYQYNKINSSLPTAVIFHDSFMDWLGPFLMDHFSRAVFSRSLDMDKGMDERLIDSEKPDIVIYECNERWLDRLLYLPNLDLNGN